MAGVGKRKKVQGKRFPFGDTVWYDIEVVRYS